MKKNKLVLVLLVLVTVFSCASKKDIVYMNELQKGSIDGDLNFEQIIQIDDELSIIVSAENPELTVQFNLPIIQQNYNTGGAQQNIRTYLVDKNGQIDFPGLGKIDVLGKTRISLAEELTAKISEYIKNPIVNVRTLNFRYSVLGEVNSPGSFINNRERISVLDALSTAGDLTIYGNRKNILLIREMDGKKHYERLDVTATDFLNSDYYYLKQNDVIYVEPNQMRVNASAIGPNINVWLSITSILISIIVLIAR